MIDAPTARAFIDAIERDKSTELVSSLAAPITEEEVAAALKKCKRGKECGPDELGNDFYRDHADAITPILTRLYNHWFDAGVAPVSFGTANVQCLRKKTCAAKPLDHRPISLLNTDYKIYSKIFVSRLRRWLPSLLDQAQTGFMPGRSIATAIDSLLAAQRAASTQTGSAESAAILLDIVKAYDSVKRTFLLEALCWTGLPERFVAMVESSHTATSSRFVVNGYLS
ncbi:reverse transcriptase [Globisporangium polare]